jgi:hypothetical protein
MFLETECSISNNRDEISHVPVSQLSLSTLYLNLSPSKKMCLKHFWGYAIIGLSCRSLRHCYKVTRLSFQHTTGTKNHHKSNMVESTGLFFRKAARWMYDAPLKIYWTTFSFMDKHQAVKSYRGRGGKTARVLNTDTCFEVSNLHVWLLYPRSKILPVPTGYENSCVSVKRTKPRRPCHV